MERAAIEAQIPKLRHQVRLREGWPRGPVEEGTRSWVVCGGEAVSEPVSGLVLSLVDMVED